MLYSKTSDCSGQYGVIQFRTNVMIGLGVAFIPIVLISTSSLPARDELDYTTFWFKLISLFSLFALTGRQQPFTYVHLANLPYPHTTSDLQSSLLLHSLNVG